MDHCIYHPFTYVHFSIFIYLFLLMFTSPFFFWWICSLLYFSSKKKKKKFTSLINTFISSPWEYFFTFFSIHLYAFLFMWWLTCSHINISESHSFPKIQTNIHRHSSAMKTVKNKNAASSVKLEMIIWSNSNFKRVKT